MPLERRGFLAGIAAAGLGALNTPAQSPSAGDSPQDLVAGLDRALYVHAEPAGEVSLGGLGTQLAEARADFHAGRYSDLGGYLPRLLSAAESCRTLQSGHAADQAAALEADSLALASEWAFKAHQDALAWVYADRALKAAKQSGSVTSIGEATRQQAIAMRRAGHFDPATELLVLNAQEIGGEHGSASDQTLAVYGSLLLTAAYSQAQHGRRSAAQELLAEAHNAAARMRTRPGTGSFASDFGVGQANVYAIGIYHALGETGLALDYTRRVRPERLPTDERRARYAVDAARVYRSAGLKDECYRALYAVGSYAPEELRRPSVRTLVEDLRYAPGPTPAGLPDLLRRAGAAA